MRCSCTPFFYCAGVRCGMSQIIKYIILKYGTKQYKYWACLMFILIFGNNGNKIQIRRINMNIIDKKINELKQILNTYKNEELSLRDLIYLDEEFNEIITNIKEIKEEIINDRFRRSF